MFSPNPNRVAALVALACFAAFGACAQAEAPEEPKPGHQTTANEQAYLEYKLKQPADANVDDATLDRYYGLKKTCGVGIPVAYSQAWLKNAVEAPLSPAHLINQVYQSLGEPCGSDAVYRKALGKIKRISLMPGGTVGKGLDNRYGYVFGFDKASGTLAIKYPSGTIYDITQHNILRSFIEKNLE